jgi:hypothetical protein
VRDVRDVQVVPAHERDGLAVRGELGSSSGSARSSRAGHLAVGERVDVEVALLRPLPPTLAAIWAFAFPSAFSLDSGASSET